jgi:NADH-quinone oxidoreductase subunit M
MNGLMYYFAQLFPALAAGAIGASMPRRSSRWERFALAIFAMLAVMFIKANWPDAIAVDSADPASGKAAFAHLLSWTIAIPIVGAVAILFTPRQSVRLLQGLTLAVMIAELVACLLLLKVVPKDAGMWLEESTMWITPFGIRWHLGLDGISLWLVIMTAAITPIAAYVSFGSIHSRIKEYCFSLLLLEAAMVGSFFALDLFVFYVFWELMLIPMYVMIGVWGGVDRIKAAIKFFIYTMAGSMLLLAAILVLVFKYRVLSGGEMSWDLQDLQRLTFPLATQRLLFFGFAIAFLIKVPMFPVHTWLPDAHTQAPTGGSIILAAVMLKIGCYGYLRFAMGLFPRAAHESGVNIAGVAVVGGILYGALCALKQNDVKRLVAYSSVSHLGYIMLGILSRSPAGMEGAILQMVNHAISTGALFLLVGVIYDRRHTRELSEFGGLAKSMPMYAAVFVVVTLSSIGLPGTNGFVGEWLVISGAFMSHGPLGQWARADAIGAALGVILGAAYMLTIVQKMFFGPLDNKKNQALPDLTRRETIALAPLVLAIFVIGLFPRILTEPMHGTVTSFVRDFNSRVELAPVDKVVLAAKPLSADAAAKAGE